MRKLAFIILIFFTGVFASNAQKVNDQVEVEHNGTWYAAIVLKVNSAEGKYYIKYKDWDDTWNEWVGPDRIKGAKNEDTPKAALTKFKVGDRVEVEYGMIPEPATVIEVGENKYHIQYDKKAFGDKWVGEKQIKKL